MRKSDSDFLNISVVQLCSNDDTEFNKTRVLDLLQEVPPETNVVFLPENSLFMKISSESPKRGIALDDPIYEPFQTWAQKTNTHILFGGNPTAVNDGVANATVWVQPNGKIEMPYSKIHLFDVDVEGQKPVRESDQFVAGGDRGIIDIHGWKVGLSICYDVRFSELYSEYAKQKVDLIAIPAAFLQPTGEAHWHVLMRARAIESQCFVVAAAQGGEHQGVSGAKRQTYGHSLVVSPWGSVLMDMGTKPEVQSLSLDRALIRKTREQIPMANHRKL